MTFIRAFFLILIFHSCKPEARESAILNRKDFQKVIFLDDNEIILKDQYHAKRLIVIDSLLLVQTKSDSSLFKIFNTKNLDNIGSFGKKGGGPNEFLYPYTSNQFVIDSTGIKLWINDLFKYKLSLVNITQSIFKGKTVIDKEFKLNPKYDFTRDLIYLNDSIFYGNQGPDAIYRHRISKYNMESDQLTEAPLEPKITNSDKIRRSLMYLLYFDNLVINPEKTTLVSAMSRFDRIDIYNLNLNTIHEIVGNDIDQPESIEDVLDKEGTQLINMRNYYYGLYPTHKYIYALHRKGQPMLENGKIDTNVEIRVFDWDGNPKFLLEIPNDLTSFTVDEKNGWIYGFDSYNEQILRYKVNFYEE